MDEWIRGKPIMVVDDESDLTVFYKISLEYYGFVVDTFNEPKEALSSFKSNYYDLVILDIKMPEMNGFELYREIKEIDPTVKLVFLQPANFTTRNIETNYCTLDKELFIRKPVENEELIKKIKRLISQ